MKEYIQMTFRHIAKLFSNTCIQQTMFVCLTLILTLCLNLQIVVYFQLVGVWGRENDGKSFLWLVPSIKVLVTASYVMGKYRTDVFASVFCNAKEKKELRFDERRLRDHAVSLVTPWNTTFYVYGTARSVWNQCLKHLFCIPKDVHNLWI